MKNELIGKAVELGQKLGHVFLTTSDDKGVPHLTIASKIKVSGDNLLSIAGWFCPGIVANLENNPNIGVTMWDKKTDFGYQLLGKKETLRETAILDGYVPNLEEEAPSPQVEREVVINVEQIFKFKQAPHSDREA